MCEGNISQDQEAMNRQKERASSPDQHLGIDKNKWQYWTGHQQTERSERNDMTANVLRRRH